MELIDSNSLEVSSSTVCRDWDVPYWFRKVWLQSPLPSFDKSLTVCVVTRAATFPRMTSFSSFLVWKRLMDRKCHFRDLLLPDFPPSHFSMVVNIVTSPCFCNLSFCDASNLALVPFVLVSFCLLNLAFSLLPQFCFTLSPYHIPSWTKYILLTAVHYILDIHRSSSLIVAHVLLVKHYNLGGSFLVMVEKSQ